MNKVHYKGFGLGLRPPHYQAILSQRPKSIDWFEIISENFMDVGGQPRSILEQVRQNYPIAMHGVGLSIASIDPLNLTYLKALKKLAEEIEPFILSDHLCFTTHKGHNSHDLLPIIMNQYTLDRIVSRVSEVQERLGRRLFLENPSCYVEFEANDRDEASFLRELIERSGCGLLLDVNNLYVNQRNLGWDPEPYLNSLPADAVGQIHLAGHSIEGSVRIDTHDHHTCPEVWQLFQRACLSYPEASPMIEWDAQIPPLETLIRELDQARAHRSKQIQESRAGTPAPPHTSRSAHAKASASTDDHIKNQEHFFHYMTTLDDSPIQPQVRAAAYEPILGLQVYRNAYVQRIKETLEENFPILCYVIEEEGLERLCHSYLKAYPPSHISLDHVGAQLASFLAHTPVAAQLVPAEYAPALADLARFDHARLSLFLAANLEHSRERDAIPFHNVTALSPEQWQRALVELSDASSLLRLDWDILAVIEAAEAGDLESPLPSHRPCHILLYRYQGQVFYESMDDHTAAFWGLCRKGEPFVEAVSSSCPDDLNLEDWLRSQLGQCQKWPVRFYLS